MAFTFEGGKNTECDKSGTVSPSSDAAEDQSFQSNEEERKELLPEIGEGGIHEVEGMANLAEANHMTTGMPELDGGLHG